MNQWTDLGPVSGFANGSARNTAGVCVFRINDSFHITGTRCPHMGYPMSKGTIRNGIVTCAWHKWDFDLEHGGCYRGACDDLPVYQHKVEDGRLWLCKDGSAAENDDWQRLLREALMAGDRFLQAKVIANARASGISSEALAGCASEQAFEHAIRAHQSLQAVRELDAIHISRRLCALLDAEDQVIALLQGISKASGPAGMRAAVLPLPQRPDGQRLREMLRFYTSESSALGIERLLLSSDFRDQELQACLLEMASAPLLVHHSEVLMALGICLDLRQQRGDDGLDRQLIAEIAWVLGAQRPQANADAGEAMRWLETRLPEIAIDGANDQQLAPEELAACLDSPSITAVFDQLAQHFRDGLRVAAFIDSASLLCARRFARLSLNNGGLWRDATRGIRLCVQIRRMSACYRGPWLRQAVFQLAFHLFESRWLQHRSAWDATDDQRDYSWDAFSEAMDTVDLRQARRLAIAGFSDQPQEARRHLCAQLMRDDLDYEMLASFDAVLEESSHQTEWQPYIAGMITYAIDQRSSRNTLAAAQFGCSFQHHTPEA